MNVSLIIALISAVVTTIGLFIKWRTNKDADDFTFSEKKNKELTKSLERKYLVDSIYKNKVDEIHSGVSDDRASELLREKPRDPKVSRPTNS